MFNIKTNLTILLITVTLVTNLSCNKETTVFKRKIQGTVTDYFDATKIEGVNVYLIYAYTGGHGFGAINPNPTCCATNLTVLPDTIEITTTDADGKFKFNYNPKNKKNYKDEGFYGDGYNYFLTFSKPNTDYFTQYLDIEDPHKAKNKIEFALKPMITVEFNISNNRPNTPIAGSVRCYGYPYQPTQLAFNGTNLSTTYVIKTEWQDKIEPSCSIVDSLEPYIFYFSSVQESFIPVKNYYSYDIVY